MPAPAEPRPFAVGGLHGESGGEGPPIVLCHGLTATRRSVIHGSRALERAGHTVVTYDARGHGESDPAPSGQGYDYPALVGDLGAVLDSQAAGPAVVGGHSMGAHTAVAYTLEHPDRVAGLVVVGPSYMGLADEESLAYWDGLADALEADGVDGFVAAIERQQPIDPRWRDSVLRFTRERMLRHRHLGAVARALREVPRSRPFDDLDELAAIKAPALVVASRDSADPGHPQAVAGAYADALPRARLAVEEEGQSPLAWQGGRLSRAIAAFAASLEDSRRPLQ
ncbi:MAG: alpha/beta fold hydrolase [Chloroflexota bacterium]